MADPEALEDPGDARRRKSRLQRYVGPARLEHGEDRHHHFGRAGQVDAHPGARAHPRSAQAVGHAVRAPLELAVAPGLRAAEHGGRVGARDGPGLDEPVDRLSPRRFGRGVVPLVDRLVVCGGAQQRQLHQLAPGIRRGPGRQVCELLDKAIDRSRVEEVHPVLDGAFESAAVAPERQQELESRATGLAAHELGGLSQELELPLSEEGLDEREHRLEQRRVIQVTLRAELADERFERQVLLGIGADRLSAHPRQVIAESEAGLELARDHQGVGEAPDQLLGRGNRPVGDRATDGEDAFSGMAKEEGFESRQERHEERRAVAPGKLGEAGGELLVQAHRADRTGGPARRRTRPVGGKLEHRPARPQPLAPALHELRDLVAVEPAALPVGEVGILCGGRGERYPGATAKGVVERRQLAQEKLLGAVEDDVVGGEEEQVVRLAENESDGP